MATVADYMSDSLVTIAADANLAEAASVMSQRRVGSVLIMDGEQIAGILTERDFVRAISQNVNAPTDEVSDWMSRAPRTISAEASVEAAADVMTAAHLRHLPVLREGRLVGMLSMRDLVRAGVAVGR